MIILLLVVSSLFHTAATSFCSAHAALSFRRPHRHRSYASRELNSSVTQIPFSTQKSSGHGAELLHPHCRNLLESIIVVGFLRAFTDHFKQC